jgi:hypothetical protein
MKTTRTFQREKDGDVENFNNSESENERRGEKKYKYHRELTVYNSYTLESVFQ